MSDKFTPPPIPGRMIISIDVVDNALYALLQHKGEDGSLFQTALKGLPLESENEDQGPAEMRKRLAIDTFGRELWHIFKQRCYPDYAIKYTGSNSAEISDPGKGIK